MICPKCSSASRSRLARLYAPRHWGCCAAKPFWSPIGKALSPGGLTPGQTLGSASTILTSWSAPGRNSEVHSSLDSEHASPNWPRRPLLVADPYPSPSPRDLPTCFHRCSTPADEEPAAPEVTTNSRIVCQHAASFVCRKQDGIPFPKCRTQKWRHDDAQVLLFVRSR